MDIYHEVLKQYWGYDEFRPLQEDIIHSVYARKDTLGLMLTGEGSLSLFKLPGYGNARHLFGCHSLDCVDERSG